MIRLRLALGRLSAAVALWSFEPRDGESFDAERSRQIDEFVDRLDRLDETSGEGVPARDGLL